MVVSIHHGPKHPTTVGRVGLLAVTGLITALLFAPASDAQWWQMGPSAAPATPLPGLPFGQPVPQGSPAWLPHGTVPYLSQPVAAQPMVVPGSMANPFSQAPADSTFINLSPVDRLLAQAAEHERNGNAYQAIEAYREALRIEPRHHNALLSYARMKHRAEDFDGAIILYGQILQYYPQNPIALNDLGLCFARKGDTAQAVEALARAVQQRPDSQRYRNNLAVVLVGAGQHAEAFEVLAAGGGPAAANYNLAWMLSRQGKGQEAIPYLHAALLSDPSFQPAITLLTDLEASTPYIAALPEGHGENMASGQLANPEQSSGPIIQLRSGTDDDAARNPVRAADWNGGADRIPQPPRVEDYAIPGFGNP